MRFLLYYFCVLALGWTGVNSVMVGLAYWGQVRGAFAPLVGGVLLLFLAARFILALLRRYYMPPKGAERELED